MRSMVERLTAIVARPRVATGLFVAVVAVQLIWLFTPIWRGPFAPLQDFGGHVSLADTWVRGDSVPILSEHFERRPGLLVPNMLAVRFAGVLHPMLSVVSGLRLWISLCLTATVAAFVWMLDAFGRSRWLTVLAVPWLWGAPMVFGFVSFLPITALWFAGIALGAHYGRTGERRWLGFIAGAGVFAFLCHGIGYVFVVGALGLTLLAFGNVRRIALGAAALAPSIVMWLVWVRTASHGRVFDATTGAPPPVATSRIAYLSPETFIQFYVGDALQIFEGSQDTASLLLLWGILIVLFEVARARAEVSSVRELVREHFLTMLALASLLGAWMLPAFVNDVPVGYRLMTPATMLAMAAPRPAATPSIARLALAAAFAISMWLGGHVHRAVARWHREEGAPMLELARQVPAGARVACVGTDAEGPIMVRKVLTTNCPGITQWVTSAYAGSAFAGDGHNAVRYRAGKRLAEIGDWTRAPSNDWDFFLVRGRPAVMPRAAKLVASARGRSEWSLFEVVR